MKGIQDGLRSWNIRLSDVYKINMNPALLRFVRIRLQFPYGRGLYFLTPSGNIRRRF
jgi:hypothetical protein